MNPKRLGQLQQYIGTARQKQERWKSRVQGGNLFKKNQVKWCVYVCILCTYAHEQWNSTAQTEFCFETKQFKNFLCMCVCFHTLKQRQKPRVQY